MEDSGSVEFKGSEDLNQFPNIELTRSLFTLKKNGKDSNPEVSQYVEDQIKKYDMAPFYKRYCAELEIPLDDQYLRSMENENQNVLERLEVHINNVKENEGDLELREAVLLKAGYLCSIGENFEEVNVILKEAFDNKTCSTGVKFKIMFQMCRLALFHYDRNEMAKILKLAKSFREDHTDWETRNKYKLYLGLFALWNRDFETACTMFHQILTTFSSTELLSFQNLGLYTILVSIVVLTRPRLKQNVIKAPEIQESTYMVPHIRDLPNYLYEGKYESYFWNLSNVEKFALNDMLLSDHASYLADELRITAYKQILCSFKSLDISFLSEATGLSLNDVNEQLSRYIGMGRLLCKIDKVNGLVVNSFSGRQEAKFKKILENGNGIHTKVEYLIKHIS